MILFDLGHVMGFTVGSTYFLQLLRNSPHNNHQFLAATAQQQLPTPHTTSSIIGKYFEMCAYPPYLLIVRIAVIITFALSAILLLRLFVVLTGF
jgi:hypothetical protein